MIGRLLSSQRSYQAIVNPIVQKLYESLQTANEVSSTPTELYFYRTHHSFLL